MIFKLSDLLKYDSIVIQCHDNPDADALASAFGVYEFLKANGRESKIIYSGYAQISKCNIKLMLEQLGIPAQYVKETEKPDLLICVDCQYGEGNVAKFEAGAVAVIDHHLQTEKRHDFGVIQPQLGSCSTLVWDLLRKEGFDCEKNGNVATALYYGLFTDTNSFSEISHPLDRDMRDSLTVDSGLIERLRFCNLTLNELEIAGKALVRNTNNSDIRYALFEAEPCDPNILGFISDLALQVDTVDVCVVYNQLLNGAKISVRSCSRAVMASEYAEFLTDGVGSGGGHRDKAGGFIKKSALDALGITVSEYMSLKTAEYFNSFNVISASCHNLDVSVMKRFRKKKIPVGFVVSTEVFEEGTPVMIRTLEGDSQVKTSADIYYMLGIKGEVYPIKSVKFNSSYAVSDRPVKTEYDYEPTVKNEATGETRELLPYVKSCVSLGETQIYAAPLERNTKVFTNWNPNGYMYGRRGDYLAVKCEDLNDVYIIRNDIFKETYEEC